MDHRILLLQLWFFFIPFIILIQISFIKNDDDYYSMLTTENHLDNDHYGYVSDQCDWSGSKSSLLSKSTLDDNNGKRLVMPIYLRCSRGQIKWFYPNGGLRVVLKLGTDDRRNFRGCIRIARNTSRNVRIYIEGKRQLLQIFAADDGQHPDRFRCFVSVNHFIALFIDSSIIDSNLLLKYVNDPVIFQYDLEEIVSSSSKTSNQSIIIDDDDDPQCLTTLTEQCTDDKILDLYCRADFVLTGRIIYYQERIDLNLIEYRIQPLYIHRIPYGQNNTIILSDMDTNNSTQQSLILNRPICPNRSSPTSIMIDNIRQLFVGKQILGKYFIECSIGLDKWKRLSSHARSNRINKCAI
ncbi:meteorin-like protein [Dermatophagoides pteronyssinus]|uniref:meteorin-like protein n=1 Tax=Dermatophagoides pteronyssinus TaxID=6956 RepID=UPI003F679CAC